MSKEEGELGWGGEGAKQWRAGGGGGERGVRSRKGRNDVPESSLAGGERAELRGGGEAGTRRSASALFFSALVFPRTCGGRGTVRGWPSGRAVIALHLAELDSVLCPDRFWERYRQIEIVEREKRDKDKVPHALLQVPLNADGGGGQIYRDR
jgi:hypothetical protein